MSSLDKRVSYLGLADFDYLSSRLLLLSALGNTGLPKAAEAFEKLLKLFIILAEKKLKNTELSEKVLKNKYKHNLLNLFEATRKYTPVIFSEEWDKFFNDLQESYRHRYPENWKAYIITIDLNRIDEAYVYLRNNIIKNFPAEEAKRVRQFGTFIYDCYKPDLNYKLKKLGRLTPKDILIKENNFYKKLDIDFEHL